MSDERPVAHVGDVGLNTIDPDMVLDHGHVRPTRFRARCGGPGLCARCRVERRLVDAFPHVETWELRGERVCRGYRFMPDVWVYVMLGDERLVSYEVAAELLDCATNPEEHVLRELAKLWSSESGHPALPR